MNKKEVRLAPTMGKAERVDSKDSVFRKATLLVLAIAEVAHDVNRAYCEALGDCSQPSWKDAPHWQTISAIKGVEYLRDNPDATPEQMHESWAKEKDEAGWKYGPVKDPEKKEHPCFVAYADLPIEQRAKDYIFRSIVRSLLDKMSLTCDCEGGGDKDESE